MLRIKGRKILKKIACATLSVGIALSYMPLSSYASSEYNSVNLDNGELPIHIDMLVPGEIFFPGTYILDHDMEAIQTECGKNGIEIKGKVRFVLEDNPSIKIVAGDAKGATGGGAGVYVPEGSLFIVEGQGTFDVKGGDAAMGEKGQQGGNASFKEVSWGYNKIKSGDGGAGGDGGGGAGAAIGTPGGNGGLGGKVIKGCEHKISLWNPSDRSGYNGQNGATGGKSTPPGDFALFGDVKFCINGGKANVEKVEGGRYGKDLTYRDFSLKNIYHTCTGGSGGGAGGNGYAAASIGSGGSGGSGGGSGATGTFDSAIFEHNILKGNGGGGGAGQGATKTVNGGGKAEYNDSLMQTPAEYGEDSSVQWYGRGGRGGAIYSGPLSTVQYGGCGGNGNMVEPASAGGRFYCDKMDCKNELFKRGTVNGNEFTGQTSALVKIVRASDCKILIKNAPMNDAYEYVDEPIEPEIEAYNSRTGEIIPKDAYEVKFFDNIDVGKASIVVHGLKHGKVDIPTIVDDNDFETCGKAIKHFTIKYGVEIIGMEVKSKVYDGKPVEPTGEPKFIRVDDSSIVVEEKLPVIVNYYDKEGNLLKETPSGVGDYQYEIVVKPDVGKYTGSTGMLDFKVSAGRDKHKKR